MPRKLRDLTYFLPCLLFLLGFSFEHLAESASSGDEYQFGVNGFPYLTFYCWFRSRHRRYFSVSHLVLKKYYRQSRSISTLSYSHFIELPSITLLCSLKLSLCFVKVFGFCLDREVDDQRGLLLAMSLPAIKPDLFL